MTTKTVLATATDVSGVGIASFLHDHLTLLSNENRSLVYIKDRSGCFVIGAKLVEELDGDRNKRIAIVLDFDSGDDG